MIKTRFLKDASMVVCAEGVAGVAALVYIMITARRLGVADYGLFQGIMGVYGVIMMLGVPMNLTVSHCVASADSQSKSAVAGACVVAAFMLGASSSLVIGLLAPLLSDLLRASSVIPVICLACLITVRSTVLGFYGVLQGNNVYHRFALARMVEPIMCLLCGTTLVIVGAGVAGALGGYLAGTVSILLVFAMQKDMYQLSWSRITLLFREFRAMVNILLVFTTLFVVSDLPSVLARAKLPDEMGGTYGALYTLRHTLLPFCSAICYPLYSHTVSRTEEKWLIIKAMAAILLLCLGFLSISIICPELVFRVIYGVEFVGAARYMFTYGIAVSLQMIAMTLMLYLTARKRLYLPLLVLPAGVFCVYLLIHESVIETLIHGQTAAWAVFLPCALLREAVLYIRNRAGHSQQSDD